jgi:hypothetical protein
VDSGQPWNPVQLRFLPGAVSEEKEGVPMGDKSPKATHKQASQKEAKASADKRVKDAATAARAASAATPTKPTKK